MIGFSKSGTFLFDIANDNANKYLKKLHIEFLSNFLATITAHSAETKESETKSLNTVVLNISVSVVYNDYFGLAWLHYPKQSFNSVCRHLMNETFKQVTENEDSVSVLLKEYN